MLTKIFNHITNITEFFKFKKTPTKELKLTIKAELFHDEHYFPKNHYRLDH